MSKKPTNRLQTKKCTKCGIEKTFDEFGKQKGQRFDLKPYCSVCSRQYGREYKRDRKDYHKQWYKDNKNEMKVYHEAYREANKEIIKKRQKNYRDTHKKQLNARQNDRRKDPNIRLNHRISNAIRKALKGGKDGRRWELLVDYTLNDLKRHLEKQFAKGMTWENYGKGGWEIDHKIPKSVFNYTKPEHRDFKRCWDLKNLQPLWAEENNKKNNHLTKHFQPSLLI